MVFPRSALDYQKKNEILSFQERGGKDLILVLFLVQEKDFGTASTEQKEVAIKDELTREENEEVSTSKIELLTKEEQAIPELSSAAEVAKKEHIEKDEQIEDEVSAANEATEDISHGEDDNRSIPVEAQKLEPPEKGSKREYTESPSTIEKSPELTLETETTSDLMSQKSEARERVDLETQTEVRTLGSNDSEIRSSVFEEETVKAGEQCKNAVGADDIEPVDIQNEKVEKKNIKIC